VPVGPGAAVVGVVEVAVEIAGGGAAVVGEEVVVVVEEVGAGVEVVVVVPPQLPRTRLPANNRISESRNIFFNFFLLYIGFFLAYP
jgi:hypothetical protein